MKGRILVFLGFVIGAGVAVVNFVKSHPLIDVVAYAFIIASFILMIIFTIRIKQEASYG